MANQFSAAQGMMDRSQQVDLLDKSFDLMFLRKDEFQGVLAQYFDKQKVSSGASIKVGSVGSGLPLVRESEDNDVLPEAQPAPGFDSTFNLVNYRLAIRVTDTLLRMQRFDRIVSMMSGLPRSAMEKQEYLRARIFNNGFATDTGADGSYLCADSHPQVNPEAGTWDNNGTAGAISYSNLQALRLLGMKMTNENGYPKMVIIKNILVPPDLEQLAYEETRSKYVAAGSLNTETQLISSLGIVVSPHLSSTTAYFGFGDLQGEEKGLIEVSLMDPEVANVGDETADIPIHKRIKFITKVGFTVSKNIYGNAGA